MPVVNLDVLVTTKDGQTIPGLKKENFKIMEDGAPQKIASFNQTEAPITAVLLVEYASTNLRYMYDALNASYTFANGLKKDDWVAVVSYDMKPQILVDFTQDKRAVMGALNMLRIPGFSERNLFDALFDTLDRIDRIDGKKYIILVSSGRDTFSKLTLDQIIKKVKSTKDVTIYAVSVGWQWREYDGCARPRRRNSASWTGCRPTTKSTPSPASPAAAPTSRASKANCPKFFTTSPPTSATSTPSPTTLPTPNSTAPIAS